MCNYYTVHGPHYAMHNSGINIYLVSASIESASHTHLHLSWLVKLVLYIWENGFDGLYRKLHTCYHLAMRSPLEKVFVCESFLLAAMFEKCGYCIYSATVYPCQLSSQGSVMHPAFVPFLVPRT